MKVYANGDMYAHPAASRFSDIMVRFYTENHGFYTENDGFILKMMDFTGRQADTG